MILTKQQAITEHRKMWNWIADRCENAGEEDTFTIYSLKEDFCVYNGLENIKEHCFLCEYANSLMTKPGEIACGYCPVIWGNESKEVDSIFCEYGNTFEEDGFWWKANKLSKDGKYKEAAEIARTIANLPVREGVIDKTEKI